MSDLHVLIKASGLCSGIKGLIMEYPPYFGISSLVLTDNMKLVLLTNYDLVTNRYSIRVKFSRLLS